MKNKKFLIIVILAIFIQIFTLLFSFENEKTIAYNLERYDKKNIINDSIIKIHFEEETGYQKLYFQINNSFSLKKKFLNRIHIYFKPLSIKIFY